MLPTDSTSGEWSDAMACTQDECTRAGVESSIEACTGG
jgi:hypothetical protein